ncbi:MAG: class I SAM-dependent methyltransferase [Candidatus Gracilibacteria bacterium]|nr:class I SAM-dependent methyltransferase [Candidatus Gracilibacteria bacterium]MDD4530904.1 class I SAM-dependent methyltransferase [Candidatus Gracilibacteria bacterium]
MTILFIILFLLIFISSLCYFVFYVFKELKQLLLGYGIPFVPTPDYKISNLIENIELKDGQIFIDLGCGDGKILQAICENFPKAIVIGYENSGDPYKLALKRKDKYNLNYQVYKKDFFTESLENATIIYSYLLPYIMARVWKKIKNDCHKGTLFYSNYFQIPEEQIYKIIHLKNNQNIYIYKV